jgi:hypothetical protein
MLPGLTLEQLMVMRRRGRMEVRMGSLAATAQS